MEFKTSDFYLTIFLIVKGMRLLGIKKVEGSRRQMFVLEDNENRESLVNSFNDTFENEERLVDARRFIAVSRNLKEQLYS